MKTLRRPSFRMLTAFAVMAGFSPAICQDSQGLLLPFPPEASAENAESASPAATVPDRIEAAPVADRKSEDAQRALELAETFLRRQQMEVTNSVPRRGERPVSVPSRAIARATIAPPVPMPAIAASAKVPQTMESSGGPSSELLPLPGNDSLGAPTETILPDADAILPTGEFTPIDATGETPVTESEVPRSDLAPAPAYGSVENQDRRGPVFRISGVDAFKVARTRGFKFTPAGGMGARDGNHTSASQFPNVLTSEVHGPRLSQLRPPIQWAVTETSNTFFLFCDANYNAVRLAPGWRIRGIRMEGPNWRWVACPRSGSNTASFSVRLHAYKNAETATTVQFAGLTLEGPEGATDWKEAFPWINGRGPLQQPQENAVPLPAAPQPETLASSSASPGDPPLPE